MRLSLPRRLSLALAGLLACTPAADPAPSPAPGPAHAPTRPAPAPAPASEPRPTMDPGAVDPPEVVTGPDSEPAGRRVEPQPVAPASLAFRQGWMPLRATGAEAFRRAHPTYDGRGVLIGILDSGIDAGIDGLRVTTTGERKILDLRDFSGEGRVPLERATPRGDTLIVGGKRLTGFGRMVALSTAGPYLAGIIRERPLGERPASDINGNGTDSDTLAVVAVRASDGWVLLADTDGDGSLADERPVRDYLVGRETFGWSTRGGAAPLTIAVNFADKGPQPQLDLFFDTSGHGSHVSGIAAGHDIYGVAGFDGVAPGAQLLGLKIANNAQGGISTTGSMLRAMDYAIRFAEVRRMPLVLNMSFGVGNEVEGLARIDRLIDSVLALHPQLVFTISAGNDGPGLSTIGFPGSSTRIISTGATFPEAFLPRGPGGLAANDPVAFFSARGGEVAKPDLVTPGVAYSTVPRWHRGEEQAGGTSMASPHAAGLATLLISARAQQKATITARQVKQALMVTAQPIDGATYLDEGAGVPDVGRAYRWLQGNRAVADVQVRAAGPNGATAAFHRRGLPADTTQRFELMRGGSAPATYALRSNAPWLVAPRRVQLAGAMSSVTLAYRASMLKEPGAYTGIVTGWTADTLAGPAFRLVNTIVIPYPSGTAVDVPAAPLPPGHLRRAFFVADSARPFEVTVATGLRGQLTLAYLHEPDGMPFREESGIPAGSGSSAGHYRVDGRDALAGAYEVVAVAPPNQSASVSMQVRHSPVLLAASTDGRRAAATLRNVSGAPVTADVALLLTGGERREIVAATGSGVRRVSLVVPAWAKSAVVDVKMDPAQWLRFTDFGATLFDSVGRQITKSPLNYAFGRLQVALPEGHGRMPVTLAFFPGFADAKSDERWTLDLSIRLYADTALALESTSGPGPTRLIVPAGQAATATFTMPESSPWPLGADFFPLGVVAAATGADPWTREVGLPSTTVSAAP